MKPGKRDEYESVSEQMARIPMELWHSDIPAYRDWCKRDYEVLRDQPPQKWAELKRELYIREEEAR